MTTTDCPVTPNGGLHHGVLSTPEVAAQSVANMAPSAAMALTPLLVFASAGSGTWLSFALALVLMLVVAACAAKFATRTNSSGSFYSWVTRGLGPGAGHAAGWGLVLGYLFTGIACVLGFEIYGSQFLTGLGLSPHAHAAHALLYVMGGVGPALVALLGIQMSSRTAMLLESVSVAIIAVLCVAVFLQGGGVFDHAQLSLKGSSAGGVVVGMVLAIFAFVGFESAGSLGHEAADPKRSVPRAILLSCGAVGLFYLLVSYTQVHGFGVARFGKATAPLPELANQVSLGFLGHFIAIGITASMFACSLACLNAAARMLFSFARDDLAIPRLARASKVGSPHLCVVVVAVPMVIIPIAYIAAGSSDVVLTGEMGTIATYGFMLAYALVCIAAPRFLSLRGEPAPGIAVLGAVGALAMAFVFYVSWVPQLIPNHTFAALTWPWWALPYVFWAWTAVGIVWYLVVRRRRPHVIDLVERWSDEDSQAAEMTEPLAPVAAG